MSTANMWSDDSDADASSSTHQYQHQPTADHTQADMSAMAPGPWSNPFSDYTENDDTRPTEIEVDGDAFHGIADTAAWQNFLVDDDLVIGDEDDDDEDDGGGQAHLGMSDLANIVSQGMASHDDLGLFANDPIPDAPPNPTFHHHNVNPLPFPTFTPLPATPPTNNPPILYPPAPPTWDHLPPIVDALPDAHGPDFLLEPLDGNNASLFHLHQHLPVPHHPQNLNPNAASNPHATALGPENYDLDAFARFWAFQYVTAWRGFPRDTRYPWPKRIEPQMSKLVSEVTYKDLEGDRRDVQGLDWEDLGVTRSDARERRSLTYKNYVNIAGSDRWQVCERSLSSKVDA